MAAPLTRALMPLQALGHFGGLFRRGIGDGNGAEFRPAIETDHEPYVGHVVAGVQVYLGTNLGFKITFLLKEAKQRVGVLLHIAGIEGRLGRVVGDLHQFGIGKPFGSRKLEDPEPYGGFHDHQDPHAVGLGFYLKLHFSEFPRAFERRYACIHFLLGEGLACVLLKERRQLAGVQVGTSGDLDGGDVLAFIGGQDACGSGSGLGQLRGLGSGFGPEIQGKEPGAANERPEPSAASI